MNTVVGFTFTEGPLRRLANEGFTFFRNEASLVHGYREFICPLFQQSGCGFSIELREVIDEEVYFQFQGKRSLTPFINNKLNFKLSEYTSENAPATEKIQQPNKIYCMEAILGADMLECELKEYLKIRKQYPIWALWLKCSNFQLFSKISTPNRYFTWHNQNAALLQLGQNCFDLLVTAG